MFTERVCPTCPELGVIEEMLEGGFTVNAAVFPLENAVPSDVLPAMDTLYGVADETTIEGGIVKLTLRALPIIVVTAVAAVFPLGATPLAGVRVTDTSAACITPAGKPEPVTLMLVMPAWPTLGEVGELRVSVVWAYKGGS
jgi:hypothetical protein